MFSLTSFHLPFCSFLKQALEDRLNKLFLIYFGSLLWNVSNNSQFTWINESHCTYCEIFFTCCDQLNINATAVSDTTFGLHGMLFYFRITQSSIAFGQSNQFCFTMANILLVCSYSSSCFLILMGQSLELINSINGHHFLVLSV